MAKTSYRSHEGVLLRVVEELRAAQIPSFLSEPDRSKIEEEFHRQ
jgi:hypothetical protein